MLSIRKLVCKPKVDDWSPLAKFYYADETLNSVANELDSFDGRKDPERCQQLVTKLRQCQDRVLQTIDEIVADAFPAGEARAPRDYRVKFPDDILHEHLPAGSNIIDREGESDAIRPLAKTLTRHLDALRDMLKEQSLKNPNSYPEKVKQALKIFDYLFAEFELNYVSAMVPVKSAKEYDLLQDVTVLFDETLAHSLKQNLITQDMIDMCDPATIIGLPRLAIVCGLLHFPDGPLNVDQPAENLAEMFRPFKPVLQKLRDLLHALTEEELNELQKLLCSRNDIQPTEYNPKRTDDAVSDSNNAMRCKTRRRSYQRKLMDESRPPTLPNDEQSPTPATIKLSVETTGSSATTKNNVATNADGIASSNLDHSASRESVKSDDANYSSSSSTSSNNSLNESSSRDDVCVRITVASKHRRTGSTPDVEIVYSDLAVIDENAKSAQKECPLRSKFRSSEDLIHRLFVCISGVADQWQSNFASDLRSILKTVLHPLETIDVFEISGQTARSEGNEEETGVEADEIGSNETSSVGVPWVPDRDSPSCYSCQAAFTLVNRRHHCRQCGRIFCSKCSSNVLPLPSLGYAKPVRVCNQCFLYKVNPFTPASSCRQ